MAFLMGGSRGNLRSSAQWRRIATTLLVGAAAVAIAKRFSSVRRSAPGLRHPALFLPVPLSETTLPLLRRATRLLSGMKIPAGVRVSPRAAAGSSEDADVRVLLFEREGRSANSPVLIWMHGGGYVLGGPELDARLFFRILGQLDILIVSVDYRLAPEHPFPAAIDDCHAALTWTRDHATELGVDPARIAVGGVSAGGGLAAALVQRIVDEGSPGIVLQLLVYPMLDDRTVLVRDHERRGELVWTPANNRWAWKSYLGHEPGVTNYQAYAVPARRDNMANLLPAWIGVGTLDLFYNECSSYADKLQKAGVRCTLDVVEGAYHSFDSMAFDASATLTFHKRMIKVLNELALGGRD